MTTSKLVAFTLAGLIAASGVAVAAHTVKLKRFAAASPATSPSPAPTDADSLVRIALEAPKHVSYVGQLQTIRWGTKVATAVIERVEHRAPADTRRTFLAPEALYGEYDVTHGTRTTKFDMKSHRVLVADSPSNENATASSDTLLLMANYRAVLGPVDIVASRASTTVSLINKFTGERTLRLWIDNDTKVVLSKEAYRSDGSLAWRTRFDEIRFNPEIPDEVFSTAVPSGFAPAELRHYADLSSDLAIAVRDAGFKPIEPHYLPDGFSLIGAETSTIKGVKSLHYLYSDGIRTLSLFENGANAAADFGTVKPLTTHFEGHDADYVKDGPTLLLSWRERGLSFALVGDLELRELTQIAKSVVP